MKVRTPNGEEVEACRLTLPVLEGRDVRPSWFQAALNHADIVPAAGPHTEERPIIAGVRTASGNYVHAHERDWIISAHYDGLSVLSPQEFEQAFGGA